MRTATLVSLGLFLAACGPVPPPTATTAIVAAPPPASTSVVAAASSVAVADIDGGGLESFLQCDDRTRLAQPIATQAVKLLADPRLHCQGQDASSDAALHCTPAEPLSVYGRRIFEFDLTQSASEHRLSMQVQGDRASLVSDAADETKIAISSDAEGRQFLDLAAHGGHNGERLVFADGKDVNQATLDCVLTVAVDAPSTATAAATKPPAKPSPPAAPKTDASRVLGSGSISGQIQYPSEAIPPMHVCAISSDGKQFSCTRTTVDQHEYRIENLAPGDYRVYGWLHEGDMRVIRASEMRWCIRAPCPPGPPITVALKTGEHFNKAVLNDYAESFPDMPAEP